MKKSKPAAKVQQIFEIRKDFSKKMQLPLIFFFHPFIPSPYEEAQSTIAQLRQVVMRVANVQSFNFAFRLIEEARMQGLLQQVELDGINSYELCASP